MPGMTDNLDFLAARVHGRRARMALGTRLDSLCQLRELPRLCSEIVTGAELDSAAAIQRRLVQELAQEMARLAGHVAGAGADLLRWLVVRFQVENLKVLVRGVLAGDRQQSLGLYLLPLPREFALDVGALASAKSIEEFQTLMPRGPLQKRFGEAARSHRDEKRPFFFEVALDQGYFEELLARADALGGEDGELVRPLVLQEIDAFHLMLVARGRFIHRLDATALAPLHVPGTGIPRERFAAMLADVDLRAAASRALGRAVDSLPSVPEGQSETAGAMAPADLEALAWSRFVRLANGAFRRRHMGLAAVVAYVALRRVEVANLITLSEGIRTQLPAQRMRARLIPRSKSEVAHV